jgi:hypothetical protein
VLTDPNDWAEETFGRCELGDTRRTARAVKVAQGPAQHVGKSLLKSCEGDSAAVEGICRLLRNETVDRKPWRKAALPGRYVARKFAMCS